MDTIDPGQTFELGGGQERGFTVTGRNVGVSVSWRPQIRRLRRSVADLAASSKA